MFHIPNSQYDSILNTTGYLSFCGIVLLIYAIVDFFLLKDLNRLKRTINSSLVVCLVFGVVGMFYYRNLPFFTYDEAASHVVEQIKQFNPEKEITLIIPEYHEDKIAFSTKRFLQTTHYIYTVFLEIDGEIVSYRYEPLTNFYEVSDRTLNNNF